MPAEDDLSIIELPDHPAWQRWLEEHHATSPGVWLKLAKRGSPTLTVTQSQALEEAMCFGWIDGQVRRHDQHFYLQRFTPRRPRSRWSMINRERAQRLISEGRMRPSGLREFEAAEADGRLADAYAPPSSATVPSDFQAALDRHGSAREFFEALSGADRYAFLYRLHHVKDPEKRTKRIQGYIERLSSGRTLAQRD